MITKRLEHQLHHSSGLVRKGSTIALLAPKQWAKFTARDEDYRQRPPVLANSFPKSGTHLLDQIVDGLPARRNFGSFLSSMTSSFQFKQRTPQSSERFLRSIVPGEIVRGHLFHDERSRQLLEDKNAVHFFIYRDPRDVVVSEAHYLREMNRWHRLHRYFRNLDTLDDAIALSIRGFQPEVSGIYYPNIAERFACYAGWLSDETCLPIRFEELVGEQSAAIITAMAEFYQQRTSEQLSIAACTESMTAGIAPTRSHTYRSGRKGGWRAEFNADHRQLFGEFGGELLIRLGYEPDIAWVTEATAAPGTPTT